MFGALSFFTLLAINFMLYLAPPPISHSKLTILLLLLEPNNIQVLNESKKCSLWQLTVHVHSKLDIRVIIKLLRCEGRFVINSLVYNCIVNTLHPSRGLGWEARNECHFNSKYTNNIQIQLADVFFSNKKITIIGLLKRFHITDKDT